MKKGFTLVEIMLTLAIFVVLATVSVIGLSGRRNTALLNNTTQQIGSLLREAQSDSASQSQGASWGVHFDNTTSTAAFYTLFYTMNGTYASGTQAGYYLLPVGLCFTTSTLAAGSTTDIIFSGISGAPSASTTIGLQLMSGGGCSTATSSAASGGVSKTGSGMIFFDDFNRSNL